MRIDPWNVNLQAFVRKLVITWVKRFLLGIDNTILFGYLAIESDSAFHPALEGLV